MNPAMTYPIATLYVGDLSPEITEAMLYEKFQTAGQVLSIRLCRDMITKESLGYAYVNYDNATDAERALDTMNFDVMKGSPIRIMWSQRDPSVRKSGVGNVFIKNLDKSIDNKSMYDTFSAFGNILSCKVATDEKGNSKGYGFVHFETEEAAKSAIEKVNGMLLNCKKVFVGRFVPRTEREKEFGESTRKFTNVYIKNFGESIDEDKLYEMFSKYGKIISHKIMKTEDGKSKGFGFVSFEDPSSAEEAVKEVNNTEVDGKPIYVGRAQKKSERQKELKKKFELIRIERINRYQGVNLYVKNLDDSIDDDLLRKSFSQYGTITSAKVMKEENRSKGFGFVCFSSSEEAARAVTEMNGRIVIGKPLYVAIAQRKEDRKIHLAAQHMQRLNNARMHQSSQSYHQNGASYFVPSSMAPQRYFTPQIAQVRPRWPQPVAQVRNGTQSVDDIHIPVSAYRASRPFIAPAVPSPQRSLSRSVAGNIGVPASNMSIIQSSRPIVQTSHTGIPNIVTSSVNRPPYRLSANMRNPPSSSEIILSSQPSPIQQTVTAQGQNALTPSILANASPHQQKQLLGEHLFPIIKEIYPELAGKITGMLLEINNMDLLCLLDDPSSIKAKADEALAVLQAHQAKQAISSKKD